MKLSEIVRRYREEHGLSIRQFAKQCDISHSKLERLKILYIEGDISKDIYTQKRDKVKVELEQIRAEQSEVDYAALERILDSGWRTMYDLIGPEDRAHFWRTILHHVEVLPDGTYKPWFNGPVG
jgi:transcriptional regulator with XRE-family HTH domain